MGNKLYVYSEAQTPRSFTSVTAIAPATFAVPMKGFDTLVLDVDVTRVAATAWVFTFTGKSANTTNNYTITTTNYSTGALGDATFTYTSSVSFSRRFTFSLSGFGLDNSSTNPSGTITVSIAATGGTTDALTVTPTVAITG